ncbi:nuclear exosome regulator NRDE2-like isoform X2 [Leguminivora glycinivorella]|uniref:nuclear exosome regulator NRDE2-like isoform X2 n=1 Tax=Leguminivora glycinivorella TaxID=1035111 RepID=UPI00200EC453|nr:nuclear exosome regulator NRDE2-like isoform X2 [Leguminivora glycinivorella]
MENKVIIAGNIKPLLLTAQDGAGTACSNGEKWRKWRQKFEIFSEANDFDKLTDKKKIAIFLNAIGDDGLEIFDSFHVDRTKETLNSILLKFDQKFNECRNTTVERYNFFTRFQKEESLDEYVTCLNNLAASCKFEDLKESLVKDMFVIGLRNSIIKEKLLQNDEITTVSEAVQIAKTLELSSKRSKLLNEGNHQAQEVQEISNNRTSRHQSRSNFRNNSQNRQSRTRSRSKYNNRVGRDRSSSTPNNSNYNNGTCRRCGQVHRYKCPAQGKTCVICKKQNHFAQCCFNKNKKDNK